MEKKKVTILKITLFFLLILSFILITIIKEKPASLIDASYSEPNLQDKSLIERFIGTCPRQRACTAPSCSLWSDINKDGMCDRSVE